MKVLIGCEESQVLCREFRRAGHEAYSCDLVTTRGNPDWHFQCDIMDLLTHGHKWDLIVLHPDCTAMALSGNRWYGRNMPLSAKRITSVEWTIKLWLKAYEVCPRVGLENPKSVIFPIIRNMGFVVQYVQPWMFGHTEKKKTGFALYNLPKLIPTNDVSEIMKSMTKAETDKTHRMAPSTTRKRDRSVTYQGIANAIVDQWGSLI